MNDRAVILVSPRTVALLMAAAQALSPAAAQAASTDLADVPISARSNVPPNLLFTLDNSGSMELAYMPEEAMSVAGPAGRREVFVRKNCFKNAWFNKMYYDPALTYRTAKTAAGASYPNANFNAAYPNPFDTGYAYSITGAGAYYGAPHFAYEFEGPAVTGPIDLAQHFQAMFDGGGYDDWDKYEYYDDRQPAYYYVYKGPKPNDADKPFCHDDGDYRKVVVSATSGPGGTDERTNFANWFSFYRMRMLAMKTGLSRTFTNLDGRYRVGFSTINNSSGTMNTGDDFFIPVDGFDGVHRSLWYDKVFSIKPSGGTPLAEAMRRAGEYFKNGRMPGSALLTDPVQLACQRNYLILATDGYANKPPSVPIGNHDGVVPALPAPVPMDPVANAPLIPGTRFPPPFSEGARASNDSLADIAMKYWIGNSRPTMGLYVPATENDPATWQHMTTFAIGMGVSGELPYTKATYDKLLKGTENWPYPVLDTNSEIDSLWHAAVNGHGKYFNANNAATLETALADSIAEIVGGVGSGGSAAVSNPNVTATDNLSFITSYESGRWSGDLKAFAIDAATGMVNTSSPVWPASAQTQLDKRDWATRNIATYSGTAGIAFTAASLTTAQLARLHSPAQSSSTSFNSSAGTNDAAKVIEFLRGDVSLEDIDYRARLHRLGDIVNADPVFVGPPSANYSDAGYAAFKARHASRAKMVYQGANDGMLHAFNATTGAEQFAYVPGLLINEPYVMKNSGINFPGTSALVNLSRQSGFMHRYYVDGTPVVADIDLAKTQGGNGAGNWITLLVGGLNKGGRGYYALDVSDPTSVVSDAIAANRVKWEFPNAATAAVVAKNIGNSYGKPVTVKTAAAGWVTLATSGYNNGGDTGGDGQGHLFVLNAANGNLIADLPTGAGDSVTPSGLAQLSAYVKTGNVDSTTDYVYGGDLLGNLWRFDLSGPTTASWNIKRLATLVDASGKPQPITTAPELANVGAVRTVYVGTGRFYGVTDLPNAPGATGAALQPQTLYGLVDNATATPTITPLRSNLVAQTLTVNGAVAVASANEVDLSTMKGWYIDLPHKGERSVSSASVALGAVSFATNIPTVDVCGTGGSSWLYVLDYKTGGFITDPNVTWSGKFINNSLASRPTLTRLKDGRLVHLIRTNDAKTVTIVPPVPQKTFKGRRLLWKEIVTN